MTSQFFQSRAFRVATKTIVGAALLATVIIRPTDDLAAGLVAGARIGLMLVVLLIIQREKPSG